MNKKTTGIAAGLTGVAGAIYFVLNSGTNLVPFKELLITVPIGIHSQLMADSKTGMIGFLHDNKFFITDQNGNWFDIALPGWNLHENDAVSALFEDRLVVSQIGNRLPMMNSIYEYQLITSNGIPSYAILVTNFTFAPNGRWSRILVTSNGGVVVATLPDDNTYKSCVAYRNPEGYPWGYWRTYTHDTGHYKPPGPTSMLAEAADNVIHHYMIVDSSQHVTLARWKETSVGLKFLDFKYSFMPDNDITPHYEYPYFYVVNNPYHPGRIDGSVTIADNSQTYCYSYKAHNALFSIDTTDLPPSPKIYSWSVSYQTLRATIDDVDGYRLRVSEFLNTSNVFVDNIYLTISDKNRLFIEAVNPLYKETTWPLKSFYLGVDTEPWLIKKLYVTDMFGERTWYRMPVFPAPDGLYFASNPIDTNCYITNWFFQKYSENNVTYVGEQPTGYEMLAWEKRYALIKRNNSLYIKDMINP